MNIRDASGARYRAAMLLGCTALAGMAPNIVFAQEAADPTVTILPTLTVNVQGTGTDDDRNTIVARTTTSGSKIATPILDTPASVSVITAKEIQQRGAQSTEEVIQYTAGVTTDFYGSDDRFDFFKIRGFDAYTYRDGLVIGAPFGGIREEPYAFERIEVLKGANSTTFGVSDPGGAVNYVTKTPKNEKFGEAYISGGALGTAEIGADFGDNITEDDTLSYRLTGKLRVGNDEYDYSRNDEQFVMAGLTWRPTDATTLTIVYDHLSKQGVPGSGGHPVGTDFDRNVFFGEPGYNFRGVDRDTLSVMLSHDVGYGLTFSSNARYSNTASDFGYAYISATPTDGSTLASRAFFGNETTRENFVIDGRVQYDATFGPVESRTLVGVEHNSNYATNKTYWGPAPSIDWLNPVYSGAPASVPLIGSTTNDQKTNALYLQQDLTFDRLTASIGLRNDWMDIEQTNNLTGGLTAAEFSEFTKRAALTYKWTDEIATYVSYAESAVPASLSVEPERGEQWEAGIKYQPEAFPALFSAAIYDLTKNNMTRTNPATLLQETIGEVRVRGIDLEAKAEVMENLSLTLAYSYMLSDIVENGTAGNEGNELSFVPNHIASLWLDYTLPSNGIVGDMTFGVGARYSGPYFFNDTNTQSGDASIVFDAAFNYKVQENTTFQLNVSNIFDEKHVAYGGFGADFYNPGRSITASLRQTW
ncbi:ligand-gated channel [Devosia yakushimensis]|uniref:Ligand-gated channel n=1 Tax=Devosia yakushimensis TaxID=470028 RepID=A0ABQ5UA27_9HYPH|nr:TonB-dependent siderophore receptor [Devosia yakushimensis]GLQ08271.1 ligand-gated channel [Devosia yakushimensis]